MSRWWALLIAVAVATAATAGPGVAAAAKPGGGGQSDSASAVDTQTLQMIDSILSAAQGEMAKIASEFVADAPAVESEAELEGMRETAEFRIGLANGVADALLRSIGDSAGSGPVYDAAVLALQQLGAFRDAALALVRSVVYSGPSTDTTTTTAAMTTTTSADAAMPSAPPPPLPDGPSTPATTVPEAPATTVPEAPATTVPEAPAMTVPEAPAMTVPESTTTTTTPGTVVDSGGGTGGGSGAVSRDQFIMAMPPDDAVLGESAATSESPSAAADLSGWLASMLDVVLPPVVVAVVLSPLIVIEVIGRAVVRSGSAILPPMVLLGLSLLFLHWSDRRRDAAQIPTDDRPRAAVT